MYWRREELKNQSNFLLHCKYLNVEMKKIKIVFFVYIHSALV